MYFIVTHLETIHKIKHIQGYGTHVTIIQPVLLVFISSKSLKIKPICSIFRHCLFDFHAFLVLHLRFIWVDWVPVDLKQNIENGFIEAGVLDAYKKYVFGGNKKLTCTYTEGSHFTLTLSWLHFVKWRVWNRTFFNKHFIF